MESGAHEHAHRYLIRSRRIVLVRGAPDPENGTWLKTTDLAKVKNTLWAAADELRANSKLTPVQYRNPVLGLVFLAYAENRFEAIRDEIEAKASARNPATAADYKAKSVLYVPEESRLSYLNDLPEGDDIGKAVDEAIKAIEAANPELKDILPRGYQKLERSTLSRAASACLLRCPLSSKVTPSASSTKTSFPTSRRKKAKAVVSTSRPTRSSASS